MSHIAVWTNGDNSVRRIHYRPEDVDTSGAVETHTEPPKDSGTPDWVEDTLYYDGSSDTFSFQSEDPFEGLNLSDTEKQNIYNAVQSNDLVEIRSIVEQALQS